MGLGDIVKKDCEAFLKKNGIKQCENMKPICSLLESFANKTVKNNSKCKVKKAVKTVSVKQPSFKGEPMVIKQMSVKKTPNIKQRTVSKQPSIKKEPSVKKTPTVKQPSIKKEPTVKQPTISPPPSHEEATKFDMELIRKYIEVTFKRVGVDFKNCDDIEKYKEELRKKCIKFLGYDSPAKTPECTKFRFRKFLKENSKMEINLMKIGCKI